MRFPALWAAVALCAAAPASAATYTVAPSGNDNNNGTSAPFRTLSKAAGVLRSGDSIVLRAGTYAGGVKIRAANVTVESYPGEVATITAPTDNESIPSSLWVTAEAVGVRLRRLKILGGSYYSLKVDGDRRDKQMLVEDCVIGQSGRDCIKLTPGADGVTIRRCEIGFSGLRDAGNAEGIDNVCADRMVVQDSWVHDIATNGIYPKGGAQDAVIERTRVENCGGGGIMLGYWTDLEWFDKGENPRTFENLDGLVRNCVIVNTKGAGIGLYSAQNARVYNNTLVNVGQAMHGGIILSIGNTTTPSENLRFINNVVIQPASSTQSMVTIRADSYSGPAYFSNNLYCKMGGRAVFEDEGWKGNLAQWQARISSDGGTAEGDPRLDASQALLAGSPCIDAGLVLADVTDDFRGTARAGAPDIGAFQAGGGATSSAPTTPQGLAATAGTGRADLRWTAGSAAGYRVYRRTGASGSYAVLATGPKGSTTYTDTAVTPGATYWYQLTALDTAGRESAPTAAVPATVPQTPQTPQPPVTPPPSASAVIYDDALQGGWTAQAWRAAVSLTATNPVSQGARSIALLIKGRDGNLVLQGNALSASGKTHLKFRLHGGTSGNQALRVRAIVNGVQQQSVNLWSYGGRPKKGEWVECSVPLADLGAAGANLTGLKFSAGQAQKKAFIDYIRLE